MNGNLFRALRMREGMTQEEFGAKLNLSKSAIANIESGRRPISDKVRARLAQKFEIDDNLLYFFESYRKMEDIFPN
ncbi:helix-turn-helix transcriptional regulator [Robertmurraya sp. DFI.2.37]|uniref:helix-turn-helix domain-containing protein n=1 Tax=Robertmurraya sp. DFI.2.37 TaxID=3031819 RepID=UPI0023D99924|nr:helix-turn-helix transcriptional regulator [Robertmurraya sp. DFI.2.37]MDF1510196.1 helix-turn-helix transcriptional regulator [Robertmurraya sp. DFI.2.37]